MDLSKDNSIWVKLEIIDKLKGSFKDDYGEVEFKAYYKESESSQGNLFIHERSIFHKINGSWFYVNKKILVSFIILKSWVFYFLQNKL